MYCSPRYKAADHIKHSCCDNEIATAANFRPQFQGQPMNIVKHMKCVCVLHACVDGGKPAYMLTFSRVELVQ
jgi:hypothetical protein